MRHIVKRANSSATDIKCDYEFTNWETMRSFARGFEVQIRPPRLYQSSYVSKEIRQSFNTINSAKKLNSTEISL